MAYRVKEMFATLQGEGAHAGKRAVFVRLAGCNMWSGREKDRERDAARNFNRCALFCDTDFVGGEKLDAQQIADRAKALGAGPHVLIVISGGEPMLQLDADLARTLHNVTGARLHLETNGTVPIPPNVRHWLSWITVSPKVAPERIVVVNPHELKVVFPAYNPLDFEPACSAVEYFVQPEDGPNAQANTAAAIEFVTAHPRWRLSVQLHKVLGVP